MKKIISSIALLAIFLSYLPQVNPVVNSATLTGGSITLSDSRPSTSSVSYTMDFDNVTTSAIKCIKVVLSDAASGGSAPTGINTSGVTYSAANSDYVPDSQTWTAAEITTGSFKITNATGETPASATDATVQVTGITNGSSASTTYYAQFSTYNNTDCSTSPVDSGVVAFIYTSGQAVSATVDPSLSFTISSVGSGQAVNGATTTAASTSTTIPFGTLSSSANKIVAHDLAVGTNAQNGYTVTIKYSGALSSGSHNMTDHSGTNASPSTFSSAGTEAFGYTTEDTTLGTGTAGRFGSGKWAGFTTSPLEVAYSASAVSETTRTGYQAGIASTTQAGSYTTTVVYTATPTY